LTQNFTSWNFKYRYTSKSTENAHTRIFTVVIGSTTLKNLGIHKLGLVNINDGRCYNRIKKAIKSWRQKCVYVESSKKTLIIEGEKANTNLKQVHTTYFMNGHFPQKIHK